MGHGANIMQSAMGSESHSAPKECSAWTAELTRGAGLVHALRASVFPGVQRPQALADALNPGLALKQLID